VTARFHDDGATLAAFADEVLVVWRTPTQGAPASMVEELPSWHKDAKHRDEILRALARLVERELMAARAS